MCLGFSGLGGPGLLPHGHDRSIVGHTERTAPWLARFSLVLRREWGNELLGLLIGGLKGLS